MADLGTFCGLSSCTSFIFSTPWQCPHCRNVPLGGIAGHQSNVNYCSHEHLALGTVEHLNECSERVKVRTMARAAAISALVFDCVQQKIWPAEYVIRAHISYEGLQVQCISRKFPWGVGEKWYIDGMEDQDIYAAMCFGMSFRAVNLNTLPMCWLLAGESYYSH